MLNRFIASILPFLPPKLVWIISRTYIAGITVEEVIAEARQLNGLGVMTTLDVLGEFITSIEQAEFNKRTYLEVIERSEAAHINGNYSLKPTFFGLLIDNAIAYHHIREIVAKASTYNNFIRIDMEDSPCTDLTIELFRKVKAEFPDNIGMVFQAYLKRTHQDLQHIAELNTAERPLNLRLCKGIYVEPHEIAYKEHNTINAHFLEDLEFMFEQKMYPAIATHDRQLIEGAFRLIEKYKVSREMYEFQMLYGMTPALRKAIVAGGHRMRVYVPFGKQWFGYATRRLKENPKLAGFILKALFKKG